MALRARRPVLLVALLLAPADLRAEPATDAGSLGARIDALQLVHDDVEAKRAALDGQGQSVAREIERLKNQPESLGRDVRLNQLLAASQERARELEQLAAELRNRDAELTDLRRRLVEACERALADPKLAAARRAELGRLRAQALGRLPVAGAALRVASPGALDPLAGPSELAERADRMKDDEDKLQREADRLERRISGLEEQRRLRERAGALEDDLFVESGVGRRALRPLQPGGANLTTTTRETAGGASTDAANSPMGAFGQTPGPRTPTSPPTVPGAALGDESTRITVLRGALDPATLDELRRAEAGSDPESEIRALRRAQGDLKARAADLARREAELRRRAAELRHGK